MKRKQKAQSLPELTFDEFTKLHMTNMLHISYDWGAASIDVNFSHGIRKEVITKRKVKGDIYSGWQEPDVGYFLGNDDREFKTVDQLYVAYMEKVCGVTA